MSEFKPDMIGGNPDQLKEDIEKYKGVVKNLPLDSLRRLAQEMSIDPIKNIDLYHDVEKLAEAISSEIEKISKTEDLEDFENKLRRVQE